jgi:hypothetical protein
MAQLRAMKTRQMSRSIERKTTVDAAETDARAIQVEPFPSHSRINVLQWA